MSNSARIILAAGPLVLAVALTWTAPGNAQTKLKVWSPQDQWQESLDYHAQHLEEFKKLHPDVEVEFVHIPYENYEAKYLTAFASGDDAPDVFSGKVAYYAGAIGVAGEAPEDLQALWSENLLKVTQPFFQVDGKWYGYPISSDTGMMIYYNVDHFKEVGLDPDKPPKTFDDLLVYAKQLATYDDDGNLTRSGLAVRYSGAPVGMADKVLPFVHAFGGRLYAPDGSTADGYLDGAETMGAMQYLYDLVNTHKVASLDLGKPVETFAAGKSAMIFREGWLEGWMADNAPEIDYRVVPLPEGPGGYPGLSLLFSWSWMVNQFSPNQEIAWDWIRTISNPETDLDLAKLEGYLPVWEANFTDSFVADRRDYEATKVIMANPPGPYYDHPYINEIGTRIGEQVQAIFYGTTPEAAIGQAVADVDRLLKQD